MTNSNYIASWMDLGSPVRPDKAPPRIKDSDITPGASNYGTFTISAVTDDGADFSPEGRRLPIRRGVG